MNSSDFVPTSTLTSEATSDTDGTVQYLLIALAGREYGVRLATMQEVLRYQSGAVAPIPNTPHWLDGIYSLRGAIISVVNLRLFLGLPLAEQPDLASGLEADLFGIGAVVPRLLVLHSGETVVGMVVDDIRGVLFVRPEAIKPVTTAETVGPYLEGSYNQPETGRVTWLLDTERLIMSPEMLVFEDILL